jgi:uncharacterized protein (DUF4415 family)
MASKAELDDDNPLWTTADFARARPVDQVHEQPIVDLLVRPRGRPLVPESIRKKPVSIRLDQKVISHFKAGGPGWQSRINEALLANIEKSQGQA